AEGDPLLASWRYGLGRVVAFASDADGPWAQAWARDEDDGRIWSQVVRWTSEVPLREPGSVQLALRGAVLDVVVDLPAEAAGPSSPSLPLATLADTHGNVWARQRLEWVSPARAAASFELATDFVGEVTVEVSAAPAIGLVEPSLRQVAWPLPPSRSIRWDVV